MALQHDNQGFLVGEAVDLSDAVKALASIRDDVRAIRRAITGMAEGADKPDPAPNFTNDVAFEQYAERAIATPAGRDFGEQVHILPVVGLAERAQLMLAPAGPATASSPQVAPRPVATPAGRDAKGRFVARAPAPLPAQTIATPAGRDGRTGSAGRDGGDGGDRRDDTGGEEEGAVRSLAGKLVNAVRESGSGMGDADPTIKAFGEVAQPLARGFELLGGGDRQKRQEGWLRRIHGSLAGFRKEEGLFNKVAAKRLKAIEEKPGAEDGGGSGSMMGLLLGLAGMIGPLLVRLLPRFLGGGAGGFLSRAFGVGAGGSVLGRIFGAGGKSGVGGFLGRLFGGGRAAGGVAGSAEGGMLARAARMAGKFGKRLPVIGSLLALGLGAVDGAAIEGDATTSRHQKNAKQGRLWGSVGGGLAGGAAGAAIGSFIFPGVGTAVGGVLGAVLGDWLGGAGGELIGEHFEQIASVASSMWTEIKVVALGTWDWVRSSWDSLSSNVSRGFDVVSKRAGEIFDSLKATIGDRWQQFLDLARGAFDSVKGMFTSIIDGLKEMEVIGPAIRRFEEAAKAVANTATEKAGAAREKTKEFAESAGQLAKDLAARTADATVAAAGHAAEAVKEVASNLTPKGLQASIAARRNWEDAKQHIVGAAGRAGVDAGVLARIANFESGFNAEARPVRPDGTRMSSAHGYGQFLDGTWRDVLNRHGAKYGIAGAGALTKEQAAALRSDKGIQAAMLAEFTRENIAKGRRQGGSDDDANVYAFHNLGDGDASKLLAALRADPSRKVSEVLSAAVIKNNGSLYGNGSVSVGEAYSRMGAAMRRGDEFAADARSAQLGIGAQVAEAASVAARPTATPAVPRLPVAAPAIATPVVVSTSIPKVPTMPAAPAYAEAPQISVPLGSGEPTRPVVVAQRPNDAGQDLRERGIAHIVTGGLAGP